MTQKTHSASAHSSISLSVNNSNYVGFCFDGTIFNRPSPVKTKALKHVLLPDSLYEDCYLFHWLTNTSTDYNLFHIAKISAAVKAKSPTISPPQNGFTLYAPSHLSLWAVMMATTQPDTFARLILDKKIHPLLSACTNTLYMAWLRFRLLNERRLMGSDVPSPFMKKALRRHISIADYFNLSIGDWLALTKGHNQRIHNLKARILWVTRDTTQNDFIDFMNNDNA